MCFHLCKVISNYYFVRVDFLKPSATFFSTGDAFKLDPGIAWPNLGGRPQSFFFGSSFVETMPIEAGFV